MLYLQKRNNSMILNFFETLFGKAKEAPAPLPQKESLPSIKVAKKSTPDTQEQIQNLLQENRLRLEFSVRMRKGWKLQWNMISGALIIVPAKLQKVENSQALLWIIEWSILKQKRKTTQRKQLLKDLEKNIWAQIGEGPAKLPPLRSIGRVHDLQKHFDIVNQEYFAGHLQCMVTWSARKGGLSFHTHKKDPKTGALLHYISISNGYDNENCPDYALQGILYHECLHIAIPPTIKDGRRDIHSKEFKQREKQFKHFELWRKWHKEILPKNVRTMR